MQKRSMKNTGDPKNNGYWKSLNHTLYFQYSKRSRFISLLKPFEINRKIDWYDTYK